MELIDQSSGKGRQSSEMTRIYRHGRDTVRIQIHRDSYEFQSYATAAVLSTDRTWTVIATEPHGNWHAATYDTSLERVATGLADRAARILG